MMMKTFPANTTLKSILSYIEDATRFGVRNRALFALRQNLRLKDISDLLVSDVLNPDMTIRRFYIAEDGEKFILNDEVRSELYRYLLSRFSVSGESIESIQIQNSDIPLFPTQKSDSFTPNTLAQHYTHQDKLIFEHFQPPKRLSRASKKASDSPGSQSRVKQFYDGFLRV
jgi:hypothetical protein